MIITDLFTGQSRSFGFVGMSVLFFNDTATTEIYTLSLHDALPISSGSRPTRSCRWRTGRCRRHFRMVARDRKEHTSELQSRVDLVCRLLLEKKNRGVYARGGGYCFILEVHQQFSVNFAHGAVLGWGDREDFYGFFQEGGQWNRW